MKRSSTGEDDPEFEEAKRAFAELGFDLELERQVGSAQLEALSALIARAARTSGTDEDGHISWLGDVRSVRSPSGMEGATWTLDAASAGPRRIERLIDTLVRGVVDLAIPVRRIMIGQLT